MAVCWGHDQFGQASPPQGVKFISISSDGTFTCGVREDHNMTCWGATDMDPDSPLPEGELLASVSSYSLHICGLRLDGAAVCWGYDVEGQTKPPKGKQFRVHQQWVHSYLCTGSGWHPGMLGRRSGGGNVAAQGRTSHISQQRIGACLRTASGRLRRMLGQEWVRAINAAGRTACGRQQRVQPYLRTARRRDSRLLGLQQGWTGLPALDPPLNATYRVRESGTGGRHRQHMCPSAQVPRPRVRLPSTSSQRQN